MSLIFISNRVHVFVDKTYSPINEQHPFSPVWFSHNFHRPGTRYTIGLSVSTRIIVLVNGPFQYGSNRDNKLFVKNRKHSLCHCEHIFLTRVTRTSYAYLQPIWNLVVFKTFMDVYFQVIKPWTNGWTTLTCSFIHFAIISCFMYTISMLCVILLHKLLTKPIFSP